MKLFYFIFFLILFLCSAFFEILIVASYRRKADFVSWWKSKREGNRFIDQVASKFDLIGGIRIWLVVFSVLGLIFTILL